MKKYVNLLLRSLHQYKPLSYLILTLLIVVTFGSLLKGYVHTIAVFPLFDYYGTILAKSTILILNFFGYHLSNTGNTISFSTISLKYSIGIGYFSLYHMFFVFIGIVFLPFSWKRKIILILLIGICFLLFNLLRVISVTISIETFSLQNFRIVREFFQLILNSLILFGAILWLKKNFALKRLLLEKFRIKKITLHQFVKRFIFTLLFLFIIKYIINSGLLPFGNVMAYSILWFTKSALHTFGYITEIINFRLIKGPLAAVKLADPCLGINLIIAFAAFITIITGKWFHKIWFITIGIVVIYFLNVVRMSLLYIYLAHNSGKYSSFLEIHDLYNYSIYILTFFLWVIWINKFSKT